MATNARGELTDQQLMDLGRKADMTKLKHEVEDINKRALEALASPGASQTLKFPIPGSAQLLNPNPVSACGT